MSSPKAATKTKAKRKAGGRPASAPKPRVADETSSTAQAMKLAAELERGLIDGNGDVVSGEALQLLMAAICKTYSQHVQGGNPGLPLQRRSGVTPTDVMITASALLKAVDLQVFELGMWQSWTGR